MSEILSVNKKQEPSSTTDESHTQQANANEYALPAITEARPIFQAIGIIRGEVRFEEDRATIEINGNSYALDYPPMRKSVYIRLRKMVEEQGQSHHCLLVYPRAKHFPEKEKQQEILFQIVRIITKENSHPIADQLKDNEFIVRGLWQFIPVCRIPCISIYRNKEQHLLQAVKKANPLKRYNMQKPTHLPFVWKDAPIKPFRYNPKAETQDDVGFVQVKAKFLPNKNAFAVDSLVDMPKMEAPPYLKTGKNDKEKAVKMMQGISLEEIEKQEEKEGKTKTKKTKQKQQNTSAKTNFQQESVQTESQQESTPIEQSETVVTPQQEETQSDSAKQGKGNKRAVSIAGTEYNSIAEAAKALGMKSSAVSYRLKSEKYRDWYYLSKTS